MVLPKMSAVLGLTKFWNCPYTKTVACPAPLEDVQRDAISNPGTAFTEYAVQRWNSPLQYSLFEWADRSPALRCLRHATYEASLDALKESRSYLSDDEYVSLSRTVLAPFITEYVSRCVGEALTMALVEAVKPQSVLRQPES